jgi:ABC-type glycerol-3-phosphate transport system substrate-binding protein
MKKLLYTILAVSIIFSACKKEEEDPSTNTTTTTSFSLEQTIWEVTSFEWDNSDLITIPCFDDEFDGGIHSIRWTFYNNNGNFILKFMSNGVYPDISYTDYDTASYHYYEGLKQIEIDVPENGDIFIAPTLNIIEHTANNLTIRNNYDEVTLYLTKVN